MDTLFLLTMLSTPKVGRKSVLAVLHDARQPVEDLKSLSSAIAAAKEKHPRIYHASIAELEQGYAIAQRVLEQCAALGIQALGFHDSAFPEKLRAIPDAPVVLYVRGNVDALHISPAIAVIGTREPTDYGAKVAERLSYLLAEKGACVVSGLAVGCDTAAHKGCLAAGGKTVAFLAHGLDGIYPKANTALAEKIIDAGGCLASEYTPGTATQRSSFVERDRLQSGLSDGVLVVETDVKGGTMHTVGFAMEQGRHLACVAHPQQYAGQPQTRGNQQLLREKKAVAVADRNDLEAYWRSVAQQPDQKDDRQEPAPPTQPSLF